MTFTNAESMRFRKLFEYLFQYWEFVRRRGRDLNDLEVSVMTGMIFAYLKNN